MYITCKCVHTDSLMARTAHFDYSFIMSDNELALSICIHVYHKAIDFLSLYSVITIDV